ncbi:acyl carrier protein 1, chloroplastic [Cocos nucifera]|nr:acyl carrier protein 1, chloroplastic [Cocos nucifera]
MAAVSATSIRWKDFECEVGFYGHIKENLTLLEAKPETVEKVCEIVKKQLALKDEIVLTPDSKFSALGADSLDTVEIVMGLEEEFGITVEEDNSQNITTIQEAADLIEKLVQQKAEA